METINIAIVDDHPMIIGGIQNLVNSYFYLQLTGTYVNGEELLQGLSIKLPDVLLLDIQMPDKSGDTLAPIIQAHYPDLPILVLTHMSSPLYVHNMFRLGVTGYVLKNSDPVILIEGIHTVRKRERYIDPSLKHTLEVFSSRMKRESAIKPTLTAREREILKLTSEGLTLKEISKQLNIGTRTVECYRSNLFIKLEVKNMAGLIKKSIELGLSEM